MPRVCFTLQVRADRLDAYRERHAAVWPEILNALPDAGWHDYQPYRREDDLLVGIVETDDDTRLAEAQAAMDATDVSARWEAEMAPFFDLPGGADGRDRHELPLVLDLDAQLRAAGGTTTPDPTGDTP